MAAISLSINRGVDFTVGTLAPNANDVELRFNTTDQNSANIKLVDVVKALKAFIRAVEGSGGGNINIFTPPTE